MGQNKRYPELLEADIERTSDAMERRPAPISLSEPELRSGGRRQDADAPIPVSAWVPHRIAYTEPQLVDGEAIAWNRTAVLIRWMIPGRQFPVHTWVWASSVTRR